MRRHSFDLLRPRHPRRKPIRKPFVPALEWLEARLAPANVPVLSAHYDGFLSGANTQETTFTPANVTATHFVVTVPSGG